MLAILIARPDLPKIEPTPQVVTVGLVPEIRLPAPEPKPAVKTPSPPKAPVPKPKPVAAARPAQRKPVKPPPPEVESLPAADNAARFAMAEVGEGELAGAATAGSGGGGGGGASCDMTRHLQDALRRDRHVLSALEQANRGRALRIWNGDWVLHPGQSGNGLAAVREAIMWEVGFAPAACKRERMRGLVLISLADRPGAARIVLGDSDWRWSDLLFAKSPN